jgi:hypothetical protein
VRYDEEEAEAEKEQHNLSWKQWNLTSEDSYSSHKKKMHLNNKYSLDMLTRRDDDG